MKMWTSVVTVFCVFVCGPACAANLIENGDFEIGETASVPGMSPPIGWVVSWAHPVYRIVNESRPGSAGARCFCINTTEALPLGGVKSFFTALDPTRPLRVSGYFRDGGSMEVKAGPRIAVAWFDKDKNPVKPAGRQTNYVYLGQRKKPTWQCFSRTFEPTAEGADTYWRIPPGAALFQIWLFKQNYPGPLWLDDIEATQDIEPFKDRRLAATAERPAGAAEGGVDWAVNWFGDLGESHEFSVRFAGDELAGIMSRVLGEKVVSVPWRKSGRKGTFVITDSAHAPPDIARRLEGKCRDAFVIKYPYLVEGEKVCLLVSNDEYGYDFPAYHFLTRFMDVHWLGPGELGEIVPRNPGWQMPDTIDLLEDPDLEMRYWSFPDFRGRRWLGNSLRYDFHHALSKVFPPKQYGESDPDLFPLVEGKRYIPDLQSHHKTISGWQPCIGNPKAVDIAARYGLDLLAHSGRMLSFSLAVNDGRGNQCECPLCWGMDSETAFDQLEPDYSDRYFRFYNQVIDRVVEEDPDAYLAVFAYGNSTTKPPHESRIHPRTIVFMVDRLDPVYVEAGAIPALYQNLMDNTFVTIRHLPHTHARILTKLNRMGGVGYYAGCYTVWAAHAPSYYVLAHLLWDAGSDVDALLDQFMRLAYGQQAAPHMRAFYDRWEDIFERDHSQNHANAQENVFTRNWHTHPPDYLRRDDLALMDKALADARACRMSDHERQRLELCEAYYQLVRVVSDQVLSAREFSDKEWVLQAKPDELLDRLEASLALFGAFERVGKERVFSDRTGWLIPSSGRAKPEAYFGSTAGIRQIVATLHETSMDTAMTYLADSLVQKSSEADAVRWLDKKAKERPWLEPYIGPQTNRLMEAAMPNLVRNPGFEETAPGDPTRVKYWSYSPDPSRATGMAPSRYERAEGTGRAGGYAAAIGGPSLYAGVSTGVKVKKGHRYRFSFWYRTVGRKYTCSINLSMKDPRITFYVPPTGGEWRQVTRTFTVNDGDNLTLLLRSGWQYRRYWTYFDDVEIVEIWAPPEGTRDPGEGSRQHT